MKKIVVILLVVVLLAQPVLVFASAKEKDKRVVALKEKFNIVQEYKNFSVSERETGNGKKESSYYWEDEKLGSIAIITNGTGEVVSYDKSPIDNKKRGKLGSKDDAIKIAKVFLEKVDPNILKNYEFMDSSVLDIDSNSINLNLERRVQKLPVKGDVINVYVNLNLKEATRFNRTAELIDVKDEDFADAKKAINLDNAKTIFKDKIGLNKAYYVKYKGGNGKTKEVVPVYGIIFNNLEIDALSGKVIEIDEIKYSVIEASSFKKSADSSAKDLTPVEKEELENQKNLRSKEEAEKVASEISSVVGYKLTNASTYKGEDGYFWVLNYIKKNMEKSFTINANTLELINYYEYGGNRDEGNKPDRDKVVAKAKTFMEKVDKKIISNLDMEKPMVSSDNYSTTLTFMRKSGDFYFINNSVVVTIGNAKGEVYGYEKRFDKIDIPKTNSDIGLDKAYEILFDKFGYNLLYKINNKFENRLVYDINNTRDSYISMEDGKLVGKNYTEVKEPIVYEDIDESKYKDEILTLTQYGIGFLNSKLNPKEEITQEDLIFLIVKLNSSYINYDEEGIDSAYEWATGYMKVLDKEEIKRDSKITYGQFYRYLLRSRGLNTLGKFKVEIFDKDLFSDTATMDKRDVPYIYGAYALGLIEGKESKAKEKITRDEVMHILYKLTTSEDIF